MKKTCNVCSKKVSLTNKHRKSSWFGLCRDCKYICEIFAWNGNLLQEYKES